MKRLVIVLDDEGTGERVFITGPVVMMIVTAIQLRLRYNKYLRFKKVTWM